MKLILLSVILLSVFGQFSLAQEVFFFREGTDNTYYDQGIVNTANQGESLFEVTHPPGLPQYNDKIPCSSSAFTGTSSLKFNYTSASTGNWQVTIYRSDWSVADLTPMDSLSFYLYSEQGIPASALPLIGIKAVNNSGTGDALSVFYPLTTYNNDIPADRWTQVRLPLQPVFADANNSQLDFSRVKGIVFNQSENDGTSRIILLDELMTYKKLETTPVPLNLTATGYDSHIELVWDQPAEGLIYRIYAAYDATFSLIAETSQNHYLDFVPDPAKNSIIHYRVMTVAQNRESEPAEATAQTRDYSDDELKDLVQRYAFRYFWEGAHQQSGMALERSNGNGVTVASGATGMGLMAMIVAHEREYQPREAIKERIVKTLHFLENCDRYHGAWSHWYNGDTRKTQPFTADDDGGDIVETSFLAQALLALRNYFSGTDDQSVLIRQKSKLLWESIEWNWYRNGNQNSITWHWSPTIGFAKNMKVTGWNEALAVYIMAAASPTYGIPKEVYTQGWARNGDMVNARTFYNYTIKLSHNWGGPLFWLHYSHLGINPHGLSDQYANYWTEHINTVRIHHAYAVENPLYYESYSDQCWGLTASDDPDGYTAHEPMDNDNGTSSPTAALASMPYAPDQALKALKYFYRERGQDLFGIYGPYDAFNDYRNWIQKAYIGIDQGPIIVMIENQRSGLLWNYVMRDTDLQAGLDKLGFSYQSTAVSEASSIPEVKIFPNPAHKSFTLTIPEEITRQAFTVKIYSIEGKKVIDRSCQPGTSQVLFEELPLPMGLYLIQIQSNNLSAFSKLIIQ